jgi:hypothetical protein
MGVCLHLGPPHPPKRTDNGPDLAKTVIALQPRLALVIGNGHRRSRTPD